MYPVKQAGILIVFNCDNTFIYQIYIPYVDITIFKRLYYTEPNLWYPWVEFDGKNI